MRLGDMLIKNGLINQEQLEQALEIQKKSKERLGSILVSEGFIEEDKMLITLQDQLGVMAINLDEWPEIEPDILKLIPAKIAKKNKVIPIEKLADTLTVAMLDPTDEKLKEDLEFITHLSISPAISTKRSIAAAIEKYYQSATEQLMEQTEGFDDTIREIESEEDIEGFDEQLEDQISGKDKPMVKLVNQIVQGGITMGASDIHIEPFEKFVKLRYRVDGDLKTERTFKKNLITGIVARIKIISHLDISEKRVPQDGKARVKYGNRKIDLRVATVPCVHGEKVVIRILDKGGGKVTLDMLGLEPEQLEHFKAAIEQPWGMILITGPTGSGKTYTLSTSLELLNSDKVNIMTAEDPVEFDIEGLNQVETKPDIGYTFATALKAFLRADPNIIMIGEIRDLGTGDIAIKAAQTGHLVFATLHTNSAPDTIARLENMGIEPFNIASSLIMVVAQRLVKKICSKCKVVDENITDDVKRQLGIPEDKLAETNLYKGTGCPKCRNTGYKGRTAVYEILFIDEVIRKQINEKAPVDVIKKSARAQGMHTLRESAVMKALKGLTTVEEVFKNTMADA
jgi:type IV pilus assembly protein PilB